MDYYVTDMTDLDDTDIRTTQQIKSPRGYTKLLKFPSPAKRSITQVLFPDINTSDNQGKLKNRKPSNGRNSASAVTVARKVKQDDGSLVKSLGSEQVIGEDVLGENSSLSAQSGNNVGVATMMINVKDKTEKMSPMIPKFDRSKLANALKKMKSKDASKSGVTVDSGGSRRSSSDGEHTHVHLKSPASASVRPSTAELIPPDEPRPLEFDLPDEEREHKPSKKKHRKRKSSREKPQERLKKKRHRSGDRGDSDCKSPSPIHFDNGGMSKQLSVNLLHSAAVKSHGPSQPAKHTARKTMKRPSRQTLAAEALLLEEHKLGVAAERNDNHGPAASDSTIKVEAIYADDSHKSQGGEKANNGDSTTEEIADLKLCSVEHSTSNNGSQSPCANIPDEDAVTKASISCSDNLSTAKPLAIDKADGSHVDHDASNAAMQEVAGKPQTDCVKNDESKIDGHVAEPDSPTAKDGKLSPLAHSVAAEVDCQVDDSIGDAKEHNTESSLADLTKPADVNTSNDEAAQPETSSVNLTQASVSSQPPELIIDLPSSQDEPLKANAEQDKNTPDDYDNIFSPDVYTMPPSVSFSGPIVEAPPSVAPASVAPPSVAEADIQSALPSPLSEQTTDAVNSNDQSDDLKVPVNEDSSQTSDNVASTATTSDASATPVNICPDPNFLPDKAHPEVGVYKFTNGARVVSIYKNGQVFCAAHELVIKLKLNLTDFTCFTSSIEESQMLRNIGRCNLKENFVFKLVSLNDVVANNPSLQPSDYATTSNHSAEKTYSTSAVSPLITDSDDKPEEQEEAVTVEESKQSDDSNAECPDMPSLSFLQGVPSPKPPSKVPEPDTAAVGGQKQSISSEDNSSDVVTNAATDNTATSADDDTANTATPKETDAAPVPSAAITHSTAAEPIPSQKAVTPPVASSHPERPKSSESVNDDVILIGETLPTSVTNGLPGEQTVLLPCIDKYGSAIGSTSHIEQQITNHHLHGFCVLVMHMKNTSEKRIEYKGVLFSNNGKFNTKAPFVIRCTRNCKQVLAPLDFMLHLESGDMPSVGAVNIMDLWMESIQLQTAANWQPEALVLWNLFVDWFQVFVEVFRQPIPPGLHFQPIVFTEPAESQSRFKHNNNCTNGRITQTPQCTASSSVHTDSCKQLAKSQKVQKPPLTSGADQPVTQISTIASASPAGSDNPAKTKQAAQNLSMFDEIPASPAPIRQNPATEVATSTTYWAQQQQHQTHQTQHQQQKLNGALARRHSNSAGRRSSATASTTPLTYNTVTTTSHAVMMNGAVPPGVRHALQQVNRPGQVVLLVPVSTTAASTDNASATQSTASKLDSTVPSSSTVTSSMSLRDLLDTGGSSSVAYSRHHQTQLLPTYQASTMISNMAAQMNSTRGSPASAIPDRVQPSSSPANSEGSAGGAASATIFDSFRRSFGQHHASMLAMESTVRTMEEEYNLLKAQLAAERREKQEYAIKLSKVTAESQAKEAQIRALQTELRITQQQQQHQQQQQAQQQPQQHHILMTYPHVFAPPNTYQPGSYPPPNR